MLHGKGYERKRFEWISGAHSYPKNVTHFVPDVLKQPLRTSVTIDNLDFDSFEVEEGLHVGITVKDFKAITLHAESLKASITALFSYPTRPMQLTYSENGMQCDFTLMTIGEYHGPSATPTPAPSRQPSVVPAKQQPSSRPPSAVPSVERRPGSMLPPSQPTTRPPIQQPPASQRVQRPSPPPPKPSLDPDSLFVHQYDDEDRPWGERNYEEEEDTVGWSATVVNYALFPPLGVINLTTSGRPEVSRVFLRNKKALRNWSRMFRGKEKSKDKYNPLSV